jgi:hypothetical protein
MGAVLLVVSSPLGAQGFCRKAPVLAPSPKEVSASETLRTLFRPAAFTQPAEDAPQTQICPDGSVIPVTEVCPVPMPAPVSDESVETTDSIVVTGSRVGGGRSVGRRGPGERGDRLGNGNRPPAGLLTSGDHDDLLNPEHFAWFVHSKRNLAQQIPALPVIDTRRSLTIELRDEQGRPRPLERVSLECSDGNQLELTTAADGKVVFFPALDRLSDRLVVRAGGERRELLLGQGRGGQQHRLVLGGPAAPIKAMDLMIVLDCTGSMSDEIAFLQSELQAILAELKGRHRALDLRVGLVAYRDVGDEFVTRTYRLSSDLKELQQAIAVQRGDGGGDMPEAVDEALARAIDQEWRAGAVKSLLWVADAPPHDNRFVRAWGAAEAARAKGIRIIPVASSGLDERAEYFMRLSAALTQSRYVFLTDDSGIGNRHKEPEVACYVVTSLASTIRRVLDSQLSGRRIEPNDAEIIRVNGDYDQGRCGLPPRVKPVPPPPWPLDDQPG